MSVTARTTDGESVAILHGPAHLAADVTKVDTADLGKRQRDVFSRLESCTSSQQALDILAHSQDLVMLDADTKASEASEYLRLAARAQSMATLYADATRRVCYLARLVVTRKDGGTARIARELGWVDKGAHSQSQSQRNGTKAVNRAANAYESETEGLKQLRKADPKAKLTTDQAAALRTYGAKFQDPVNITPDGVAGVLAGLESGAVGGTQTTHKSTDFELVSKALDTLETRLGKETERKMTLTQKRTAYARLADLAAKYPVPAESTPVAPTKRQRDRSRKAATVAREAAQSA